MILGVTIQRYAPDLAQAPHSHDTTSVTLVLRGSLRERACGEEVTAAPLSLVVKPAETTHANLFGSAPVVTCQIRLDADADANVRWRRALGRWRWIIGGPAVEATIALARDLAACEDAESLAVGAAAVIEALDDRGMHGSQEPPWLARVIDYLDAEVSRGAPRIRVTAAAEVAGVHPVHLARVFQQHVGCTVPRWVRRRRGQRAADCLGRSGPRLSSIAAHVGFADQSHMNRSFRADAGLLPASFRDLINRL